ncbi:Uncharacterized conserved protein [Janthinobacterium sp. Marseille]|nr:DUF6035 family protein [Janthinobacterium sp. Marseille]ABR91849.1 Uncharacterized conserved protein [Janthinobacterium sp. Marseille]
MVSESVIKPTIPVVLNMATGAHESLNGVGGNSKASLMQRRMEIKEAIIRGKPIYVCSECHVPVSLLQHHETKRFFFRHQYEDGRCRYQTKGDSSQEEITARQYNGAKESDRHRRMKALMLQSLRADKRFTDLKSEKRWRGINGNWRQPDVQAQYRAHPNAMPMPVVFEIQLSTTFLDVIAERRVFYQDEGALLFWVFADFNETGRRLMQDDVFFNNNQNAFLVTEETTQESKENHKLIFECAWATPMIGSADPHLNKKQVEFSELTIDLDRQRVFFVDVEAISKDVSNQEMTLAADSALKALHADFFDYVHGSMETRGEGGQRWAKLRAEFLKHGVKLPEWPNHLPRRELDILYSAKAGKPIGWNYKTLVDLAHHVYVKYPGQLRRFRHALIHYDRADVIRKEDNNGSWQRKAKQYRLEMAQNNLKWNSDDTHSELFNFIFPELAEKKPSYD